MQSLHQLLKVIAENMSNLIVNKALTLLPPPYFLLISFDYAKRETSYAEQLPQHSHF